MCDTRPTAAPQTGDQRSLTVLCAWCQRVRLAGRWQSGTPYIAQTVTHSICPDCYAEQIVELQPTAVCCR